MENVKGYFFSALKGIVILLLSCLLFVGLYFLLKTSGILGKFSNTQELKQIILSAGIFSYTVFVVLQFLQVTCLPLPASVTTIVGVIIFGPSIAFILSLLAILLGSICAYLLGKTFGIKLLNYVVGKKKSLQMQELFKKGKYVFFIMMLFPFFPDDILCIVAGVSNMDFKFFLVTNLITRTIGIFCLCFLGSIPFKFLF